MVEKIQRAESNGPLLRLHGTGWALAEMGEPDTFSCGTVTGTWARWCPPYRGLAVPTINILGVDNEQHQGNGHFKELLQQLPAVCAAQQSDLVFEFVQARLRQHLLAKWGFRALDRMHVWRACCEVPTLS